MGCLYHPDRPKTARCYKCRADLCATCAIELKGGRIICHRCLVAVSLQEVKSETGQRRPSRPVGRFSPRRLWPPTPFRALLLSCGVLVLLLIGLQLAWNASPARRQISLDPERPVQVLVNLQFALEQYAVGHGDQYPETLLQLLPLYLPDTSENRRALRMVDYRVDQRSGYRLEIKKGQNPPSAQGIMVTRDKFYPPGFENLVEER
jgi:hypothetical protein